MKSKKDQKWIVLDELPNKRYRLWLNTKNNCKECFFDEDDPNLKFS